MPQTHSTSPLTPHHENDSSFTEGEGVPVRISDAESHRKAAFESHHGTGPSEDVEVRATREFFEFLLPAPRDFVVRLWDGSEFGGEDGHLYTLVLRSPGSARRMFNLPVELALGEALIHGDFDIQGDFFASFSLKERARASVASPGRLLKMLRLRRHLPDADDARRGRGRARLSGGLHSRSRDREAIQYHYDVGNEFYALWLDERMIYTCAYYRTGAEDLTTAQVLKLDHICRKLRLKEGERVLDIGCGWGAFCIHAAQKYGAQAVGVTLSQRQFDFASARVAQLGLDHLVEIRLQDYRDVSDTFDKVVSIGMFEAVGPDFATYFRQVHRILRPGGLFLNHSIASNPTAEAWARHSLPRRFLLRNIFGTGLIREKYIFPDGQLIPLSYANLIAEHEGFEVRDVESLREHYPRTLRAWLTRLEQCREAAIHAADETVYRTWRMYLAAAVIELEKGTINVNQTLFERPLAGRPAVPPTREDLYI